MPLDPICKKIVSDSTEYVSDYGGKPYYFCSPECKQKFEVLEKSVIRLKRNLSDKEKISFGKLKRDIIKPGICTLCGACAASCECITIEEGKPKLVGPCKACGVCYYQCPRTITTEEGLIGNIRYAYAAKSAIPELKGQDGGVVTSLLLYALDEGLIDCAVVTGQSKEEPWKPMPMVAKTREEILESGGSIYSHSMTLEALMSAIKQGMNSIAFVGTSCNIDAVTKMQKSSHGLLHLFMRAKVLKLGLFCMDTFSYEGIKAVLESYGILLEDVDAMKIRKGKFEVFLENGETRTFELSEFDEYRSSSCKFCTDLTGENSDISFGGVGSPKGWTTVLARSAMGYEIFKEAVDSGYIEAKELTDNELEKVLNLAKMKKVQMYALHMREKV
ncbi:Coenzyme F420 hydrogenase/dehydrogenase, beta subunit C-terminal domain [Methanosarcina sp. Mfa9]|uniref:Coenzyme F420 hydrogenase/dehydrogenase, beta subunit C-terminal domain n=1 Tax=Methanosarcina sp. Mfa9 TaxID=3439063 RepID=UPI003F878218